MSLLDAPEAQALLADATVAPASLRGCRRDLEAFLARYLPLFYRVEMREHARTYIRGLLSSLRRKTCLPIAIEQGVDEKPLQYFVGLGSWDDEAVMAEVRVHVAEGCGHPDGVLILDPRAFAKKGAASCGVKRQWCGRLGKVENCQVGVFLAYSSPRGRGPLDRRLYLPEDWACDPVRRKQTHVPPGTAFGAKWQLGLELLAARRGQIRHGWITGDDEFGRPAPLREQLRAWGERYVLDVPCDTLVRDLQRRRPPRRRGQRGRSRKVPFVRAAAWAAAQAPSRWQRFKIAAGHKGPLLVDALRCNVQTRTDGRVGPLETLLVTRSVDCPGELSFALTNAEPQAPLEQLLRVKAQRRHIEELFEEAKGEAGLSHYEVRSWTGWHHHATLALLALWFLETQRRRLGGKKSGHHRATGPSSLRALAS